jgi:DNA-binding MarR family transcriptional regulator
MLAVLAKSGRASMRPVASHMRVACQFVTAQINTLIRSTIVEKKTSDTDRRSVNLSPTEKENNGHFSGSPEMPAFAPKCANRK